jgi:hypothetical protein
MINLTMHYSERGLAVLFGVLEPKPSCWSKELPDCFPHRTFRRRLLHILGSHNADLEIHRFIGDLSVSNHPTAQCSWHPVAWITDLQERATSPGQSYVSRHEPHLPARFFKNMFSNFSSFDIFV